MNNAVYIAPELEILEFEVERGFALSCCDTTTSKPWHDNGHNGHNGNGHGGNGWKDTSTFPGNDWRWDICP